MTSKHSIVQLEKIAKLVSSIDLPQLSGVEDVYVLSRNPGMKRITVWDQLWDQPLFRPPGVVIHTHHPDKPERLSKRTYAGTILWNQLPAAVRQERKRNRFKSMALAFLLTI